MDGVESPLSSAELDDGQQEGSLSPYYSQLPMFTTVPRACHDSIPHSHSYTSSSGSQAFRLCSRGIPILTLDDFGPVSHFETWGQRFDSVPRVSPPVS
jgi:hypothetical protein